MIPYLRKFGSLAVLMLSINTGHAGMFGLGKKAEVFLCPDVQGQITLNGEPVAGVKILREVVYDDSFIDYATSSESGTFRFDELRTKSRTPNKAFDETRNVQVITAEFKGKQYLLWGYATSSITEEPLITDKLARLKCELTNEEKYHHFPIEDSPHLFYNIQGICRWDD